MIARLVDSVAHEVSCFHCRCFPVERTKDLRFLDAADFRVPAEDRLAFERNGHSVTRGVFSLEQLKALRPSIVEGERTQSTHIKYQ